MLPVNLLNALKEYALAQRTPLPAATKDAPPNNGQQFEVGQKLQGSVQAQVAPNVFKVNVSGQLVQMQLPPTVRSGDTVALQVISLQPRLTFSMVNSANPLSTPEQLGSMARLLSSLSQQAPEKAYVRAAQSTPLWEAPRPPESKQLAGMLKEALGNSGLFYESHQAQWLEGSRSITQLMHEPQNLAPEQARAVVVTDPGGKVATTGNTANPAASATDATGKAVVPSDVSGNMAMASDPANKTAAPSGAANKTIAPGNVADKTVAVAMGDASGQAVTANDNASRAAFSGNAVDTNAPTQPGTSSLPDGKVTGIPEHLQPLVQQQLNALETRQMLWQGNVWTGQQMQWEIHEEAPQTPGMGAQRQWVTQIQLDLPKLGAVAATLRLNSAGLSLTLDADSSQTRAVLGNASTRLVSALADAGIPVLSTRVAQ